MAGPGSSQDAERMLIGRARDGDLSAWQALVFQHQATAFRAANLVCRSPELAEELTRDAFVRGWHALASLRDDQSYRAWIVRIVTGLARTARREDRRRAGSGSSTAAALSTATSSAAGAPSVSATASGAPLPPVPGAPVPGRSVSATSSPEADARLAGGTGSTPGTASAAQLERDLLIAALERLAVDDRLVICCHYLFGMSQDEVAQVLGVPAVSVPQRLTSALGELRGRLVRAT